MNLRQIEVFRAVMLAGSVTDAARLLHVSQPGISRMLGHIETQLGVALFERQKGRLLPTPEAQVLYAEVEQVYRGVKRIDDCAAALRAGSQLTLRVLASPSTGLEIVPGAVAALSAQFPGARLFMETLPARAMVAQLLNREADIAISTLPLEHPLLQATVLGHWTLACVFPRGHAFEAQTALRPQEILQERLIRFSADTPQGRTIADWCRQHGMEPQAPIEVRAGQAACALAASGAGVAVVDSLTAHAWSTDRLAFRPVTDSPAYAIWAVTHRNLPQSMLLAAFVAQVERHVA